MHETHTGIVALIGERAFKAKKPLVTDFLDFSTTERRERACRREVDLNRRLAPHSYLGVGHFCGPQGGLDEPVVAMYRYADSDRLARLVMDGKRVDEQLVAIADMLARFHSTALRGERVDAEATTGAFSARWHENLAELKRFVDTVISGDALSEIVRLADQFLAGRAALFARRINDRRIVDGHGDLMTQDIFCPAEGPVLLDCLEFDDRLRYVDGIDDASFLAMDLEFLGRKDLGDFFLDQYRRLAADNAPRSLTDFCIAYRAVVRAKVDCIRVTQGHRDAAADAVRHIDMALDHLRSCTVQLIVVAGGPGTGKTTLSRALAQQVGAQVLSTDDVRRELQLAGVIEGRAGNLNTGLYAPENVSTVYDEVLRRAQQLLAAGSPVILDGTWRDAHQRERTRTVASETASVMVEFECAVPLSQASERIVMRGPSASDATPQIAAALAGLDAEPRDGFAIDTSRPIAESVAEAQRICCLAI